jgi:hypothetical protein
MQELKEQVTGVLEGAVTLDRLLEMLSLLQLLLLKSQAL